MTTLGHVDQFQYEPLPEDAVFSPRAATPKNAGKPRRKPESEVVAEALKLINARPDGHGRKTHGGTFSQVGEPDIDACIAGRAVKLEAKTDKNKPTGPQMVSMRRWGSAGALAGWFTSNAHVLQLLDHLDEPGFMPDLARPGCSCEKHGGARAA